MRLYDCFVVWVKTRVHSSIDGSAYTTSAWHEAIMYDMSAEYKLFHASVGCWSQTKTMGIIVHEMSACVCCRRLTHHSNGRPIIQCSEWQWLFYTHHDQTHSHEETAWWIFFGLKGNFSNAPFVFQICTLIDAFLKPADYKFVLKYNANIGDCIHITTPTTMYSNTCGNGRILGKFCLWWIAWMLNSVFIKNDDFTVFNSARFTIL